MFTCCEFSQETPRQLPQTCIHPSPCLTQMHRELLHPDLQPHRNIFKSSGAGNISMVIGNSLYVILNLETPILMVRLVSKATSALDDMHGRNDITLHLMLEVTIQG